VRKIMRHSVDKGCGVHWGGKGLAVLIHRNWFREEGVEEGVSVKGVQLGGGVAVHCVPGLASEEMLVKQSSVRTHESGS